MTLTAERISFACEFRPAGHACPVRFSWLGVARETHDRDTDAEDTRQAIAKAVDLGWWFAETVTACPRHAARIEETHGRA